MIHLVKTKKIFSFMSLLVSVMSFNAVADDKTGTNPINFANDIRAYNEFSWLNTEGDGTQNLTTVEMRTSFLEGKWQFRARTRLNNLTVDINDDGTDDVDDSGMGDTDMRFLTVLDLNKESMTAWATGLEVFLDTASEDSLGSGATAFGPQLFYVKFLKGGLFAPAVQYKFSVDEEKGRQKIDQLLIDLNYLKMADDKLSWFFANPQIVMDNENDKEFSVVDLEWGWMMANWADLPGHSFYVRPSFGIGNHRAAEGSIEVGYKVVGW